MELFFRINKPLKIVFDYLADMQKYAMVHPVIYKIDFLGNNNYLVYETLHVGFVAFSFTYPASVHSEPQLSRILVRSTVMQIAKIQIVFDLKAEGADTIIHQKLQFPPFWPLKFVLQKIFRKQYTRLFANIQAATP